MLLGGGIPHVHDTVGSLNRNFVVSLVFEEPLTYYQAANPTT